MNTLIHPTTQIIDYSLSVEGDNNLMKYARQGDAQGVELELSNGADVNAVNTLGQSALVCAVLNNQREVIQCICGMYKDLLQVTEFKNQLSTIENFNDEEQSVPFAIHKLNNVAHLLKMKEALARIAQKNASKV